MQAVVSCRGAVLAGTQGVRAEHARIDAIWLNPNVASWTRKRVAARYPSARIYTDRSAMLAEHPLSALECYEPVAPHRVRPRLGRPVVPVIAARWPSACCPRPCCARRRCSGTPGFFPVERSARERAFCGVRS